MDKNMKILMLTHFWPLGQNLLTEIKQIEKQLQNMTDKGHWNLSFVIGCSSEENI